MITLSLRAVRDNFSATLDQVADCHERVTITRNGKPAAVLLSPDDLEALEETLSVLSDPQAMAALTEAEAAYQAGDVLSGVDATQALLDQRRRP